MSQSIDRNKVNILIGHLTIQGGKTSESERPLTIGTVESVEKQSFKQFDYVMLGHLHHPLVLMIIRLSIVVHCYNIHFLKLIKRKVTELFVLKRSRILKIHLYQ